MRVVMIMCMTGLAAGCRQAPGPDAPPSYRGDIMIVARALLKAKVHYRDLHGRGPLFIDDRLMRCEPRDPGQDVGIDPDPPVVEVTCTIRPVLHDVAAIAPPPSYLAIMPPNPMKMLPANQPRSAPPTSYTLDLTTDPLLEGRVQMTIEITVTPAVFDKLNGAPRGEAYHRTGFPELLARYRKDIVVRSVHLWRQ